MRETTFHNKTLVKSWLNGLRTQHSVRENADLITGLAQLSFWYCHKLQCGSQMWLGLGVAVAVVWAGNCSSDLTSSPGTSICCWCRPKKKKKTRWNNIWLLLMSSYKDRKLCNWVMYSTNSQKSHFSIFFRQTKVS